jgi:hypothetical protein
MKTGPDFWPCRTPTDIVSPVAVEVLSRIVQKLIFLNAREHGLTFKLEQMLIFQLKKFFKIAGG